MSFLLTLIQRMLFFTYILDKIISFLAEVNFGQQKFSVHLKLPWSGNISMRFESQIKQVITKCILAVNPRIVYSTKRLFHPFIRMLRRTPVPKVRG